MAAPRSELLVFGYTSNVQKKLKCIIPHEIYHIVLLFYPDLYSLTVNIHQLDKLMIMDMLSRSSDPYVLLTFNGIKNKTSIYTKKTDVYTHTALTIPIKEPIPILSNDEIIIQVMDHDMLNDDIIGTLKFKFSNIKQYAYFKTARWVHMYGAPQHHKCKNNMIADKMTKSIIPGTTFRGSVLLSMQYKPSQHQSPQRYTISWNKKQGPKITDWILEIDVYKAIGINQTRTGKKLRLKMMIRNDSYITASSTCQNGVCEWYEIMRDSNYGEETTIQLRMPMDVTQCPDIIFYLIQKPYMRIFGGERDLEILLFKRLSWSDIFQLGFDTPPQWYSFESSQVLTTVKEDDECVTHVLLGIRVGLEGNKPKTDLTPRVSLVRPYAFEQKDENESKDEIVVAKQRSDVETMGRLQVTVVNTNNAPMVDMYVAVTVNGVTCKTSIIKKNTLQSVWNETFTFEGISIYDTLKLQLNRWNRFGAKIEIGKVDNVILINLLNEARGTLGVDFNYTKKYFVSEKYKECTVTISISFDFDARTCMSSRHRRTNPIRQFLHLSLLGKPMSKLYKITVYVHYIELFSDWNDDNRWFFQISHCGKSNRVNLNRNTSHKSKRFKLDVYVPEPIKYAPDIRCAVCKWDVMKYDGVDSIGRFFVSVCDVLKWMNSGKMRIWKDLILVKEGEASINSGRLYCSVEMLEESKIAIQSITEQEIEKNRVGFIEKQIEKLSMKKIVQFTEQRSNGSVVTKTE